MEAPLERGRRLGRKYTLGVFTTLAGGFVVWTSVQITLAAFGVGAAPLAAPGPAGTVPGSCEGDLRSMSAAVDRAVIASANAPDDARASEIFQGALAPEWNDEQGVQARCGATEHGADAFAALLRYRGAGVELARRHADELAPLRKDLAVYLPPDGHPK